MTPKPLPDQPVILEAMFHEAKRYLEDFGPISNKLLELEQNKLDGDASLMRFPWDLDYQKALIDDIYKRLAASSGGLITLNDYLEDDFFADFKDFYSRMGGADPNSNPTLATIIISQRALDKVRVLYRDIIAKLENQKALSPASLQSLHPIHEGHPTDGLTTIKAEKTRAVTAERLTPAVAKAYQSYKQATEADPSLLKDIDVYNYIKYNGCELYEGELPDYETWARYLRQSRKLHGTQKNNPRAGRHHGRSVIRQDEAG